MYKKKSLIVTDNRFIEKIILNISIIMVSFLSSRIMIINNYPLGISVVSSVSRGINLFSAIFGSSIGYLSVPNMSTSVRYISTLMAVFMIRIMFKDFKSCSYIIYVILTNFIPSVITGFASRVAYGITLRSFTECILESLIISVTSYFLKKSLTSTSQDNRGQTYVISIFLSFVIIFPFMNLKLLSVNVINSMMICTTLCSGYVFESIGGGIFGLIQSITCMISRPYSVLEFVSYPFAGIISGSCKKFGKYIMGISYIISNFFVKLQINSQILPNEIMENIAGILLFILISKKIKLNQKNLKLKLPVINNTKILAVQNIMTVKNSIENVGCNLKNSSVSSDSKQLVNSYLTTIAKICDDFVNKMDDNFIVDENLSFKISKMIKNIFKVNCRVNCIINSLKKILIQIEFYNFDVPNDLQRLEEEIYFICDKPFMNFETFRNKESTILKICERAIYRPHVICKQCNMDGEKFCGDNFKYFFDGMGKFYLVISDGMGTGLFASILGKMTVDMIENMLRSNINIESAISIANSVLMVKSKEESLSTVDILILDMYSGDCNFCKAGSPSSFVKKKEQIIKVPSGTYPIGILPEVKVRETNLKINTGDIILMVSDGITDTGEEWIEETLKNQINEISLNDKILKIAQEKRSTGDDITSITIKISNN